MAGYDPVKFYRIMRAYSYGALTYEEMKAGLEEARREEMAA